MLFINVLHYLCDISYYFLTRRARRVQQDPVLRTRKERRVLSGSAGFSGAGSTGLTRIFYGREKNFLLPYRIKLGYNGLSPASELDSIFNDL